MAGPRKAALFFEVVRSQTVAGQLSVFGNVFWAVCYGKSSCRTESGRETIVNPIGVNLETFLTNTDG